MDTFPAAALLERYCSELRNPSRAAGKPRRFPRMADTLESLPVGALEDLLAAEGRVWIWSDLLFGHENIIRYCDRPWRDIRAMNESLINAWRETAAPEDTVLVLGDVCMRAAVSEPMFDRIRGLPGRKLLVVGNHDLTGSGALRTKGFDAVYSMLLRPPAEGRAGLLCTHVPVWALPSGWINVHGHMHNKNAGTAFHINVSVEQLGYRPVAFEQVEALAEALNGRFPPPSADQTTLERLARLAPLDDPGINVTPAR